MDTKRPVRVAVVGSGMAGLVTAYLLRQDARQRYDVTLLESGSTFSLDSASVSIPSSCRTSYNRVDLPMRAFAGGYYTNLKAMYDHFGIRYHNQPFLFEFAKASSAPGHRPERSDQSYFVHASNLHKLPLTRPNGVALISYLVETMYLLACYAWFSLCCFCVAPKTLMENSPWASSETVEQYLKRIWLPEYFVTYYLLPLMSSVTTCPHQMLLGFPAHDLIQYKRKTHGAPHYTVLNGVKTVQDRLAENIRYEMSTTVTAVQPEGHQVKVSWRNDDADGEHVEAVFDRVVLAVAPNIVATIFEPLRYLMSRIPTVDVESVVHMDRRLLRNAIKLPEDAHAQLIYLRTDGPRQTESLHVQPGGAVVVTTCPSTPIDPSLIIHSARFTRVLRSPESRRIVNNIFGYTPGFGSDKKVGLSWEKNGDNSVWLVGGWCWDGMVLLEGCIISAMRVARAFDVEVPW